MGVPIEIVIDCADPDRAADFWAGALRYRRSGTAANYRSIVDPEGRGPKIVLQGVAEPKIVKNRMHIDVQATDIEAEANRLVDLGARRLQDEPFAEHGVRWILLADPDGNELCVCESTALDQTQQ
jgi:predicted enzyme related to lactoylglutathione lyase